ncbi:MAG: hypothetical protein ACE5KE_02790 [Methanosarcinales archaeon]
MKSSNKDLRNNCPDKEVFIKAFLNEIGLEEKEKLINHILICNKCRLKFDVMKQVSNKLREKIGDFEGEEFSEEESKQFKKIATQRIKEVKRPEIFFRFVPAKILAIAAGLLIIIAGYFLISKFPKREIYREVGKGELRLKEPIGKISTPPAIFRWSALKEADFYKFELIDSELNTIWTKTVHINKVKLPGNIRQKLKKAETYICKVEAFDDKHNKLDSDFRYFEIE